MRFALMFAAVCVLFGCTRTPAQTAHRQSCLARAALVADVRADRECPDSWTECPARESIMVEYQAAQEQCR